jgi:FkbM family methyltransferase
MNPIRALAHRFGFDIHRYNPYHSADLRLFAMLVANRINLVLDVGANTGQYAKMLRHVGYSGRIVSFEPLSDAHRSLVEAASRDANWTAAERVAIGSSSSELTINIAGNSMSSSLLPMADTHASVAPESVYIGTETVRVVPLDEVAPKYASTSDRVLLKLDVQGYEAAVLEGAPVTLANATGVQLEMSFVELYVGQPLFQDLFAALTQRGFELWGLLPGLTDASGRMLQCDGVFFKRHYDRLQPTK